MKKVMHTRMIVVCLEENISMQLTTPNVVINHDENNKNTNKGKKNVYKI